MELWQIIGGVAGVILFGVVAVVWFFGESSGKDDNPFANPGWEATGSVPEDFKTEEEKEEAHAM